MNNVPLLSSEFRSPYFHRARSPLIVISSCFEPEIPPAPDAYVNYEAGANVTEEDEDPDDEEEEERAQRDGDGRERLASAAVLVVRRCGMEGFRLKKKEEGLDEESQVESKWGAPSRSAFQRQGKIFRENERRRH